VSLGSGCPLCKNKTEKIVYDFCTLSYKCVNNQRFDWCKNTLSQKYLPFDIFLNVCDGQNCIIEVDGIQHFQSGRMFSDSNINCHDTQRQKDT
jgi:hypothetical protein